MANDDNGQLYTVRSISSMAASNEKGCLNMTCPKCGCIIDNEQALFCPNCGTKLAVEEKKEQNQPLADENSVMSESQDTEKQKSAPKQGTESTSSGPKNWRQGSDLNQTVNFASPQGAPEAEKTEKKDTSECEQGTSSNQPPVKNPTADKNMIIPLIFGGLVIIIVVLIVLIRFTTMSVNEEPSFEQTQTELSDDLSSDSDLELESEAVDIESDASNNDHSYTSESSSTENVASENSGKAWIPLPADPDREEVLFSERGVYSQEDTYVEEDSYENIFADEFFLELSVQPEYVFSEEYRDYCIVDTNNDNLNIRSGPGTDYNILGKAPKDAILSIVGYTDAINDWILIDYNGAVGWVSSEYLAVLG